jgi:hypothetical protein
MARGDHIYVRRGRRYSHHGVDCGDGSVIHFTGPRGTRRHVARTPLEEFAAGSQVQVRIHDERLHAEDAIRNAESRLGSVDYHLVRNNCEHFAAWCCTGRAASSQVRRWMLGAQGTIASLLATQGMGVHAVVLGTAGAGVYALARPRLRTSRLHTEQAASHAR